ncbi:hypothetical protein [Undibacterium pigrum]|uniref:Apea-like HEPN domain-containing protein n=1 Tax=Undibacterium pigrum TaxID=401470 RepID=A0A318J434_9BURK|nr:hypothetical protein [Undibacterium pigrum]PXX42518.1 hypothetical protein DFR42_105176 [Undibacterium pigrum]
MITIHHWLQEMAICKATDLCERPFPILIPGMHPIDIEGALIRIEPKQAIPTRLGDSNPFTVSLVCYPDKVNGPEFDIFRHEAITKEFGAILSIVINRRILSPTTFPASVSGENSVTFMSMQSAADRSVDGPIPENIAPMLTSFFAKIKDMPEDICETLSAASSLHHSALQLFGQDLRSAYLLCISALEHLSRKFGNPPSDWSDWDVANKWDAFFSKNGVDSIVAQAFRDELMRDRHLRLQATFTRYIIDSLSENFWNDEYDEWLYGIDLSRQQWLAPNNYSTKKMSDFIPRDLDILYKMAKSSYKLRNDLVHNGKHISLKEVILPFTDGIDSDAPFPFFIIRRILRDIILQEINKYPESQTMPKFTAHHRTSTE